MCTLPAIVVHTVRPTFIKYEATSASMRVRCAGQRTVAPTIMDNAS